MGASLNFKSFKMTTWPPKGSFFKAKALDSNNSYKANVLDSNNSYKAKA